MHNSLISLSLSYKEFRVVIPFADCFEFFLQYPKAIQSLKYVPNFAIRGLHFDLKKVSFKLTLDLEKSLMDGNFTKLSDDQNHMVAFNATNLFSYCLHVLLSLLWPICCTFNQSMYFDELC